MSSPIMTCSLAPFPSPILKRPLRRRANALIVVSCSGTRAVHLFKVHHDIITKHLARRHDVEVVAVTIFVRTTTRNESVPTLFHAPSSTGRGKGGERGGGLVLPNRRAPLRIPIIRTQIRHHDRDTLPVDTARAAGRARRGPRARQLVARPAPGAAPRRARRAEQGLRAGRRVDAARDACLPAEQARGRAAAAGTFLSIVVTLDEGGKERREVSERIW